MSTMGYPVTEQTDLDLVENLEALVAKSNGLTAEVLAHLAEVDTRMLFAKLGYPSLFAYATERLGLSESAAFRRIQCARLARRFPVVLDSVARGDIHLAGLALLAPHASEGNLDELLKAARRRSKRAIEELLAARFPKPDVVAALRRLPAPGAPGIAAVAPRLEPAPRLARATTSTAPAVAVAPAPPLTTVAPLSAERFRLQVTLSRRGRDLLLRAVELMRHQVPDGDLAAVCERALETLVTELERRKFAKKRGAAELGGDHPRRLPAPLGVPVPVDATRPVPCRSQPGGSDSSGAEAAPGQPTERSAASGPKATRRQSIPAAVRRAVAERDSYQCTYVSPEGHRCRARGMLEYHHCEPCAMGGETSVDQVTLRCRMHNAYAAQKDFGRSFMEARRRARLDAPAVREAGVVYRQRGVAAEAAPVRRAG